MKVLFLDIDGVLNTKYWYTQVNRNTPKDKYGYAFDPNAVANLKRIVEESGADIVSGFTLGWGSVLGCAGMFFSLLSGIGFTSVSSGPAFCCPADPGLITALDTCLLS